MSDDKDKQIAELEAEIRQLRASLGDARRKLERSAALLQFLWSSDGPAEEYQKQRDSALSAMEFHRSLLEDRAKNAIDLFRKSDGVPVQGQEWRRYEPFAIGLTNALIKRLDAELAQEIDAAERQIALVNRAGTHVLGLAQKTAEAGWHAQRWALYWIGFRWRMAVWNIVDKPEFLALNIVKLADQGILPDDSLIARLCQTWEKRPTEAALMDALKAEYAWRRKKPNQGAVAVARHLGIDERTLSRRRKLYEDLQALAASATIEDEDFS